MIFRIRFFDIVLQIVLLAAAFWLLHRNFSFVDLDAMPILLTLLTAFFVHIIKGLRLYIALYGNKISPSQYILTYCKVTPINVIFPFKLGELYRIYCFGRLLSSWLKGLVIILLDRFVDSLALVTIILFLQAINNDSFSPFIMALFLFLAVVTFAFFAFPGIYVFWNNYLLRLDASDYRLKGLKLLQQCKRVYDEIEQVIKGRGIILLMLSFAAWTAEIGLLIILNIIKIKINISEIYTATLNYLLSAVVTEHNAEMSNFILINFIMVFVTYCVLSIYKKCKKAQQ